MTDRLKIYNGALTSYLGERAIANLSVNEESRRLLDQVWQDGGVKACLEQGQWKFAMRTAKLTHDTSLTPDFGPRYAFAKASDWVTTSAVCQDEYYRTPLLRYQDEVGYIFADIEPIYVRYVSDGAAFGGNLAAWPANFTEYVKAYFAGQIVRKLTGSSERWAELNKRGGVVEQKLLAAKNVDAMADPTKFPPPGSWNRARNGWGRGWGPFGDGGTTGSLTG